MIVRSSGVASHFEFVDASDRPILLTVSSDKFDKAMRVSRAHDGEMLAYDDVIRWLIQNNIFMDYAYDEVKMQYSMWFDNHEDAIAFKMFWL